MQGNNMKLGHIWVCKLFGLEILEIHVEMVKQVFSQFVSIVFGKVEIHDKHRCHSHFALQPNWCIVTAI